MIPSAFLYIIYGIVYGITAPLRAFSDVELPEGITSAITTMGTYLAAVEPILPIATLLAVLGIILVAETSIFVYKVIMWLIRRLPTQS